MTQFEGIKKVNSAKYLGVKVSLDRQSILKEVKGQIR